MDDAHHRERAKKIVEFWNRRAWLRDAAPLHVHPIDLAKLEELIATELARGTSTQARTDDVV